MVVWMEGQIDGWMKGWLIARYKEGWKYGWMVVWMEGQIDGWMEG